MTMTMTYERDNERAVSPSFTSFPPPRTNSIMTSPTTTEALQQALDTVAAYKETVAAQKLTITAQAQRITDLEARLALALNERDRDTQKTPTPNLNSSDSADVTHLREKLINTTTLLESLTETVRGIIQSQEEFDAACAVTLSEGSGSKAGSAAIEELHEKSRAKIRELVKGFEETSQ